MVYRRSWLAGIASLVFAFIGLNGLLRSTVTGPPWQWLVLAGLVLGIAITWACLSFRLPIAVTVAINLAAMVVAVARIAAPETTVMLLPTGDTISAIDTDLSQALSVIRHGLEPVIPISGIVIILTVIMWVTGTLLAWGLLRGHPYVALVPPLVMSLQFATMDRGDTTPLEIVVFLSLLAASMLAITIDERDQTAGRMVRDGQWPKARSRIGRSAAVLIGATMIASLTGVAALHGTVPRFGLMSWRTSSGLTGEFFGSVSYNPFVGIRQSLVSNTVVPVFRARISGDLPADRVYFRLVTMETYAGGQFYANKPDMILLEQRPWELAGHSFSGETASVTTFITIERLVMDWIPEAYVPTDVIASRTFLRTLRVRPDDGSLRLDGGLTLEGMTYSIESEIPVPDVEALASTQSGELSASFQAAQEAAENVPEPVAVEYRANPPDVNRYLQLPDDLTPAIGELARLQTAGLETSFEKALALEAWLRSPAFRYTTDIEPGHGATDLAAWLLDQTSPNFHSGYCENFATSMAVMARTLGIPSRVVLGFTPGEPDPENPSEVVVRDRNAHAWVELWMPTQGWVHFDPTPRGDGANPSTYEDFESILGFSLIDYLEISMLPLDPDLPSYPGQHDMFDEGSEDAISATELDGESTGIRFPGWVTTVMPFVIVAVLALVAIPGIKWRRHKRRMKRLEKGDISAAWEEIVARLTDLGEPPNRALTPNELAASIDEAMRPLASVYGRTIYGPEGCVSAAHIDTARASFQETTASLTSRYRTGRRILAWYRPATLLPRWARRRADRSKGAMGIDGNRRRSDRDTAQISR